MHIYKMFVDESNVLSVYQSVIKMYLNVYDHYCVSVCGYASVL
jgi:hypothetical protein